MSSSSTVTTASINDASTARASCGGPCCSASRSRSRRLSTLTWTAVGGRPCA